MPLDSNKTAHIQAVTLKTFQARQKTVVFVYQSGGVYSYTAQQVILRPQNIIDPEIPNLAGRQPQQQMDMVLIAPITTNFVGVVYVADTTTASASGVAAAPKYEIIEALPVGIVPGGTHYIARLRRLR